MTCTNKIYKSRSALSSSSCYIFQLLPFVDYIFACHFPLFTSLNLFPIFVFALTYQSPDYLARCWLHFTAHCTHDTYALGDHEHPLSLRIHLRYTPMCILLSLWLIFNLNLKHICMFKKKKIFTTKPGCLGYFYQCLVSFIKSPILLGSLQYIYETDFTTCHLHRKNLNYYKYACLCAFPKLTHIVSCYITQGSM